MKYFVSSHKEFELPEVLHDKAEIIWVGPNQGNINIPGHLDSTLESISEKNTNYSELTALYWIWKNVDAEFVAFSHYRRYYATKFGKVMSSDEVEYILKNNNIDVIVPSKRTFMRENVESYYKLNHHTDDLREVREVVSRMYPDYISSYDEMLTSKYQYNYNMMATSKKLFDEYAEFMFSILFEYENGKDLTNYDSYQSRIYGFISERLLQVWINHNKLATKELFVVNTEKSISQNLKEELKNAVKAPLVFER